MELIVIMNICRHSGKLTLLRQEIRPVVETPYITGVHKGDEAGLLSDGVI